VTTPVWYTTKDPNTVQAMLFDGDATALEAVRAWVRVLLDDETAVSVPNGMTANLMFFFQDGQNIRVGVGNYVYWDGEKVSIIPKDVFELVYAPSP
jgi:hypothetical protein